jgi:outer membrane protein, multidrug efflux system
MRRAAYAPIILLLASCLGPTYRKPPVAVPEHWQETPPGIVALPVIGSRLPVSDPTLDALIRDAISANLDLRAAVARVREARAQRGITASRGKPQVAATATALETERSNEVPPFNSLPPGISFGDRRDELFDAGFDASWELDLFGGIRRDVEAAVAQVQATDEQRRDVQITLISEVARNYVELRGAQRRLDVLDARIQTFRDTLEMTRSRQAAGLTNDLDVVRSQALLEDTLAARPALEYASAAAMHRLAVLTGRQPEELVAQLMRHEPIPIVPPEVAAGMPLDVIEHRPDVRRAERELAAATARIDVARADLYPRVSLLGSFGHRSDETSNLLKSAGGYWSFGPALRWPLLTGGRVRGQIDAATARRDQVESAYQQSILLAMEDVENSLAGFGRDQQQKERLASAVAAEARAVDLADSRYRAGLDSFLAVLDAQRTLRDGEDRLAEAQTRVAVSAISLYKALGGEATR